VVEGGREMGVNARRCEPRWVHREKGCEGGCVVCSLKDASEITKHWCPNSMRI